MTRDELRPGVLVLVPHGGNRIGSVLARIRDVPPNSGRMRVQRWQPGAGAWTERFYDVADCLARPVPATDRRLAQVRRAEGK